MVIDILGIGGEEEKIGDYHATQQIKLSLLEKKLKQIQGAHYTIPLADLVMMQMAGDFDAFLGVIDNPKNKQKAFSEAKKEVDETRRIVTSGKIFDSIVEKTIEAQIGEKHATLREMAQNGMDSYSPGDGVRDVVFDFSTENDHHLLRVRDYGVGMDLKTLIRDLLIPYNSNKEFDPTKIGEHGIGWYSLVDIADLVHVITRPRNVKQNHQALIYKKDERWMSTILSYRKQGFHKPLDKLPYGTEVIAYIPKETTTKENIEHYLYQHVGMVKESQSSIFFGHEKINAIRSLYEEAPSVDVDIGGVRKPLTFLVGRGTLLPESSDERLKHRYRNLSKILFTQRGLFVKYDDHPFGSENFHSNLINSLMKSGVDFAVDIPEHATLTKGRNNITAQYKLPIVEGMYESFEKVVLDVLLSDSSLARTASEGILEGIGDVFDFRYKAFVEKREIQQHYPFHLRVVTKLARYTSNTLDALIETCKAIPPIVGGALAYPFTSLPADIADASQKSAQKFPEAMKSVGKAVVGWSPYVLGTGALVYGGMKLYEYMGWHPLLEILGGAATIGAGFFLHKKWNSIKEDYLTFKNTPKNYATSFALDSVTSYLGMRISKRWMKLMNKIGLYVDLEKKRKKKREKKLQKITKKYLSDMCNDQFFNKVLTKKIIPADFYYSEFDKEHAPQQEQESLFSELFSTQKREMEQRNEYDRRRFSWGEPSPSLQMSSVKISIDELVHLFLQRKLIRSHDAHLLKYLDSGDYVVDSSNPLVDKVLGRVKEFGDQLRKEYDVTLLEDHLNNIGNITKAFAALAYFLTPVGVVHILASYFVQELKTPFQHELGMLKKESKQALKSAYYFFENKVNSLPDDMGGRSGRFARKTVKYTVGLPFLLAYNLSVLSWKAASNFSEKRKFEEENPDKETSPSENRLGKVWKNFYSDLYEIFGYGIRTGNSISLVEGKRLESTVHKLTQGHMYSDFYRSLREMNNLVGEALNQKPYPLHFSYTPTKIDSRYRKTWKIDEGFFLNDQGKLVCELGFQDKLLQDLINLGNKDLKFGANTMEAYSKNLNHLTYTLLDIIIHKRAHHRIEEKIRKEEQEAQIVMKKDWKGIMKGFFSRESYRMERHEEGKHPDGFYEEKENLRRQVCDYILEKRISPTQRVESVVEGFQPQSVYYMDLSSLRDALYMTPRRLSHERKVWQENFSQKNSEKQTNSLPE